MVEVTLPDGSPMPALGLGTWRMGERRVHRAEEVAVLRHGFEHGIRLVDTAEMYGDGGAEEVVGEALEGLRDDVFVVSKVYPHNASRMGTIAACERSLARLRTDRIDLYLLHWRGSLPLVETVEALERLRSEGRIRHWGVSNFDTDDMRELQDLPAGAHCAANQVYYSASRRGVEHDLLPWLREHAMPMMAYCPLDEGALASDATLERIGANHGASAAQIAIAWLLSRPGVVPIPKAGRLDHVDAVVAAAKIRLSARDFERIDRAFPPPTGKEPLSIV